MALNDDDLIKLYRWMVLTRTFDQRVCDLQFQRGIPELQHASIGQEAIGVGACYGLRPDDVVLPSLRTRAAFLVKGISPERQMAALYGKATGAGRGKETSHHMGDRELGVIAGSGVVGGSIPVGVGAALAFKLQNSDRVCLTFFGDGASNRGDFHESLNLASVYKLPVVFVCENNLYALSMSISRHLPVANVADRAAGYGMPGVTVDGNDVVAVYEAMQQAIARARAGEGPSLVECKSYRWRGHSERDVNQVYRTQEEVEKFKAFCPIKRLRERLVSQGVVKGALLDEIDREVAEVVERAVKFAEESPNPAPEEALLNAYATCEGC
ncbi:MAG: thiamine pyrophosphate-dependent dehydrogenase E1 component subunit alpha [Chloroflexota bacterium]